MLDTAKIKQLREEMAMTQEEAGLAAGFNGDADPKSEVGRRRCRTRWNDLETGRRPDPQFSTVVTLARALGCTVDELVAR